jgi:hypothetical protein
MFFREENPIPKTFWSFETSESFKTCTLCSKDLTEEGSQYLIEKVYKKAEVIFEYAMCLDCREKTMKDLSKKSLNRIAHYFDEYVDMEERSKQLAEADKSSLDAWISHCMIKRTPIKDSPGYHICGNFSGLSLVRDISPYALSHEAMEDIMNLLSPETLGTFNDLSDKLFGIDMPNNILIL